MLKKRLRFNTFSLALVTILAILVCYFIYHTFYNRQIVSSDGTTFRNQTMVSGDIISFSLPNDWIGAAADGWNVGGMIVSYVPKTSINSDWNVTIDFANSKQTKNLDQLTNEYIENNGGNYNFKSIKKMQFYNQSAVLIYLNKNTSPYLYYLVVNYKDRTYEFSLRDDRNNSVINALSALKYRYDFFTVIDSIKFN